MKYLKSILFLSIIFFISNCTQESFDEDLPAVIIDDFDGNDFFLRGTYDGQPFEINHYNHLEFNRPILGGGPFEGSEFIHKNEEGEFITFFTIAITKPSNDTPILDVLQVGEFSFEDVPIMSPQEPFKWYIPFNKGFGSINGTTHLRAFDSNFDKIEIKEIVAVDSSNDPGVLQDSEVYKVTGKFQLMLLAQGLIPVEFIIDDFSLLFDGR